MLERIGWLSDAARLKLATDGRLLHYRARQTIYLEHRTADQIFLLLSGIAKIYYSHSKGRVLVTMLRVGDIFGLGALLPHERRRYSCEAVRDCVALGIDAQTFSDAVFEQSFEQARSALANTIGPWLDLLYRYAQFVRLGTRGRLALSLLEIARKFGVRDARGLLLPLAVSHAELGTLVGSSRQHITTQLKEFERSGGLLREGRRLIVVPELLQREVDS